MRKKISTEEFINKAREVHGDKYDYSKVNYMGTHIKVCIICPKHGEFWQTPSAHLNGQGCPKCAGKVKLNTSEFINKAREVHGDKYDYSTVNYVNSKTKVCIICPEHGEFWQTPNAHLRGDGCPKCGGTGKLNTNEFIKRSREIHGDKYDYSKINYVNSQTKVCIICPKHGEFWQTPSHHLKGIGCPKCGIELVRKSHISSIEEFINKAREVHGNKYDYSKINYMNSRTKVCIICPEHGEFWQTPNDHLNGRGCPKCAGKIKLNTSEFINRAREVHGDKYDYSKVEYVNANTKVCIICPKHGEFWQTPSGHLSGKGCPKCANELRQRTLSSTLEGFIKKAREVHGDKYDYSKVKYVNSHTKVCIICPEHGEFWQTPASHLSGKNCPKCGFETIRESNSSTTEEFIKKAREVHGDKYDYSKVNYMDTHTKVCIICTEHGEFWQTPASHLKGSGCPNCNSSKLESEIRLILNEQGIKYSYRERKIPWLKGLELDFYIPDKNIAIECQGIQHFNPIEYFGGEETFNYTIENDNAKRKLCEENGVRLLYYSNLGIEYPYKVFENKKELLKEIVNFP